MAEIPTEFLVHTVTVRAPGTGTGFYGDPYGPPVDVKCNATTTRRRVRTGDGIEYVTETTLRARLSDAEKFPPGTRIGILGRTMTVDETIVHDDAGRGAWQHVQVVAT